MSDLSLVLQSVTRQLAGEYTCLAANSEGKGTSNPVALRVRCKLDVKQEKVTMHSQRTLSFQMPQCARPITRSFRVL